MFWFFALLINLNGLLINLNQTSKEFQDCFYTGCPTILFPHLILAIAKLAQKTNNLDILKNLEKMKTGAKKFKVAPVILISTFCDDTMTEKNNKSYRSIVQDTSEIQSKNSTNYCGTP